MRQFAKEDNIEWGPIHIFYANMGGFGGRSEDIMCDEECHINNALGRGGFYVPTCPTFLLAFPPTFLSMIPTI
jgi:hypothetical protein